MSGGPQDQDWKPLLYIMQMFGVGKVIKCFGENSLILAKAADIAYDEKDSKRWYCKIFFTTLTFYFNILKRTNMLLYEYADLELNKYLFIIIINVKSAALLWKRFFFFTGFFD